jgi:hypothetical protein
MPMQDVMSKLDESRNDKFNLIFNWVKQGIIRKNKDFKKVILYLKEKGEIK